jgi:hypothetical protein
MNRFLFHWSCRVIKIAYDCCGVASLSQPRVRQPPWPDPEVRAHVLQAVLPQQRQGHRLHQGIEWFLPLVSVSQNLCLGTD